MSTTKKQPTKQQPTKQQPTKQQPTKQQPTKPTTIPPPPKDLENTCKTDKSKCAVACAKAQICLKDPKIPGCDKYQACSVLAMSTTKKQPTKKQPTKQQPTKQQPTKQQPTKPTTIPPPPKDLENTCKTDKSKCAVACAKAQICLKDPKIPGCDKYQACSVLAMSTTKKQPTKQQPTKQQATKGTGGLKINSDKACIQVRVLLVVVVGYGCVDIVYGIMN